MPTYRSSKVTEGRRAAGARMLWRATGMTDTDFGKPIIAVANSFTQFVPGHVHLKDLGQLVAQEIAAAGGVAREFNTIAKGTCEPGYFTQTFCEKSRFFQPKNGARIDAIREAFVVA